MGVCLVPLPLGKSRQRCPLAAILYMTPYLASWFRKTIYINSTKFMEKWVWTPLSNLAPNSLTFACMQAFPRDHFVSIRTFASVTRVQLYQVTVLASVLRKWRLWKGRNMSALQPISRRIFCWTIRWKWKFPLFSVSKFKRA